MPLNPNVPEGLKNPRFELAEAETWMTVSPSLLENLLVATALVAFLVWLWILSRRRTREGGWTILACAIPHLILSFVLFFANYFHLTMIIIYLTPYRAIFAEQLELTTGRFLVLLLCGFGWGFVTLWTGLWLIINPQTMPTPQRKSEGRRVGARRHG